MEKLRKSKRAVSPLIATVLLMAFAIALGAIVMTWGRNYVTDTTEDVTERSALARTCALDINYAIQQIGGSTTLCRKTSLAGANDSLDFVINNKGDAIDNFQVAIIDQDGDIMVTEQGLDQVLNQAGFRKISIGFKDESAVGEPSEPTIEDPIQVVITPKIKINENTETFCSDKSLEEDIIKTC